jgi:hypothetical protein
MISFSYRVITDRFRFPPFTSVYMNSRFVLPLYALRTAARCPRDLWPVVPQAATPLQCALGRAWLQHLAPTDTSLVTLSVTCFHSVILPLHPPSASVSGCLNVVRDMTHFYRTLLAVFVYL